MPCKKGKGKGGGKRILAVLVLLALLLAPAAIGKGFDYAFIKTYKWVPGSSTNQLLDLSVAFGTTPDLITMQSYLFGSGTNFRAALIQSRFTKDAGLTDATESDLITTALSAAQKDSIFDAFAVPVPASGKTFYGRFYWAAAPAATDTILIDGYKLR